MDPIEAMCAPIDKEATYVLILRLMKKGLNGDQIGKYLGVKGEVIRHFLVLGRDKYGNPNTLNQVMKQQAELEMDYIHSDKAEPDPNAYPPGAR